MKNREGRWKLTPSGLYQFEDCQTCFWLKHHHGEPPSLPWLLNSAMDSILKTRYDFYRSQGILPPEISHLTDVSLFQKTSELNSWRYSTYGLQVINEDLGFELCGKIDEILVEKDGKLIPADYKSSGYVPKDDKQKYYTMQLTAYGYMFKNAGYDVSNRAVLLHYYVKDTKQRDLAVDFGHYTDWVNIDVDKFEEKIKQMLKLLNGKFPGHNEACRTCQYRMGVKHL